MYFVRKRENCTDLLNLLFIKSSHKKFLNYSQRFWKGFLFYSKEPQSCFEIAFIWPKRAHRWQMQITKGRLSIICKYTTLQLCRVVGEESIGFSQCIFCCSHPDSHSYYNNLHYTNSHIVPMLQITKSKGNQECCKKLEGQSSYSFSCFSFFRTLQRLFPRTICLFIHNNKIRAHKYTWLEAIDFG